MALNLGIQVEVVKVDILAAVGLSKVSLPDNVAIIESV